MDSQIVHILHRIEGKLVEHDGRFDQIDRRLDSHDQRFDLIDQRFDGIDQRLDGMDERHNSHDQKFLTVEHRFDEMQQFINDELNRVYGKLEELQLGQRRLELLFEHDRGQVQLLAEGFTGHSTRLDGCEQRLDLLESA